MSKVYITSIYRTAVGKFSGALKNTTAVEMTTQLLDQMIEKDNFPYQKIDEVILGNVLSGGQGQNAARQVVLSSKYLNNTIPAYSVNMVCGSGLKTIGEAFHKIKGGFSSAIVAGGFESMSQAGFVLPGNLRTGQKMGDLTATDIVLRDGLTDGVEGYHMGITAENLAEQYAISRADQDVFAFHSQEKAKQAQQAGKFKAEILPISIKKRKETLEFAEDEFINYKTTLDKLSGLRPAFKKNGSVTAGNSSGINDGAAIALVVSEKFLMEHQLTPMVEILGFDQAGVAPEIMGIGPAPAIQKVLKQTNKKLAEIDVIELNEAFAAQSLAVVNELSKSEDLSQTEILEKTNVNGGAIAIGHPLGASGARIATTLVHEMKHQHAEFGLAALCIGGGMGCALVVKNMI